MLRYYAEHFTTVEINNTFYRMPAETVLAHWAEEVPDNFSFTLKAPAASRTTNVCARPNRTSPNSCGGRNRWDRSWA